MASVKDSNLIDAVGLLSFSRAHTVLKLWHFKRPIYSIAAVVSTNILVVVNSQFELQKIHVH